MQHLVLITCPLGHKTQRRDQFLQTLYAFHKGYWYSIPALIWSLIHKFWDGVHVQGAGSTDCPIKDTHILVESNGTKVTLICHGFAKHQQLWQNGWRKNQWRWMNLQLSRLRRRRLVTIQEKAIATSALSP